MGEHFQLPVPRSYWLKIEHGQANVRDCAALNFGKADKPQIAEARG
jgi:hypothetical protein